MSAPTPYDQGRADGAAAAAAHTRKGKPKPSRSDAAKSGDQSEYLRGWAEAQRQHQATQTTWYNEENTMPSDVTITTHPDRSRDFWADMGPFFAHKDVRKEMPYLVDDDGYIWFVARRQGQVVGFASCEYDGRRQSGVLHGLYVVPDYRRQGVADQLVRERVAYLQKAGALTVRATVSQKSLPVLLRHRFENIRPGKEYSVVERSLLSEAAEAAR